MRASQLLRLGLLVTIVAGLAWHAWQYAFITDDAYISFVYARNLVEHGELTFNLGQRVEGYTNFLWTLLVALSMGAGSTPEMAAQALALVGATTTLLVVGRIATQLVPTVPWWWARWPAALLAASAGYACWTSGGLETQLFVALATAALWSYGRLLEGAAAWPVGLLLALAAMTRPEGLLLAAGCLGNRLVWAWGTSGVRAMWPAFWRLRASLGLGLLVWGPWFAWRWWYYGWPWPNTYYVKATGPWAPASLANAMAAQGRYYIWQWLTQSNAAWALMAALVLAGLLWRLRGARPRQLEQLSLWMLLLLGYLLYAARVGGDFMGLHRFVMLAFVLVVLLLTGLAGLVREQLPHVRPAWWLAGLGLTVGAHGWTQLRLTQRSLAPGNYQSDRGIDTPRFLIAYTEDRAKLGRALAPCVTPHDVAIVGGAGALPYFSRLRSLDVFGLVAERVAHEAPRTNARPGHTKWGSDELMASYAPTLVLSCYALATAPPASPGPSLPCAAGWVARGFEELTLEVPGLVERGTYFTFLARRDRRFTCPGIVRRTGGA